MRIAVLIYDFKNKLARPSPNAAPLTCPTKLDFKATADSDGMLASNLIREGLVNNFR